MGAVEEDTLLKGTRASVIRHKNFRIHRCSIWKVRGLHERSLSKRKEKE